VDSDTRKGTSLAISIRRRHAIAFGTALVLAAVTVATSIALLSLNPADGEPEIIAPVGTTPLELLAESALSEYGYVADEYALFRVRLVLDKAELADAVDQDLLTSMAGATPPEAVHDDRSELRTQLGVRATQNIQTWKVLREDWLVAFERVADDFQLCMDVNADMFQCGEKSAEQVSTVRRELLTAAWDVRSEQVRLLPGPTRAGALATLQGILDPAPESGEGTSPTEPDTGADR
jgi:hypothetical protein